MAIRPQAVQPDDTGGGGCRGFDFYDFNIKGIHLLVWYDSWFAGVLM